MDTTIERTATRSSTKEQPVPSENAEPRRQPASEKVVNLAPGLVYSAHDKPSKVDLLGRSRLVRILKGIIDRDSHRHLCIALFGQWGSGKSSVIQMLEDRYRSDQHCDVIVFNAWQNEHSQNITASIANRVVEQLYESKNFAQQLWIGIKQQLLDNRAGMFAYLSIAVAFVCTYLGYFIVDEFRAHLEGKTHWLHSTALFTSALPLIKKYWNNPFSNNLRKLAKRPDFGNQIGVNHTIREQLNTLLRAKSLDVLPQLKQRLGMATKTRAHKYVLVIDDLDRCSDEKILQILEAVQLVVDLDHVVVILSVDQQLLLNAIASRYLAQRSESSEAAQVREATALKLARNYLGKLLQVTISLDSPTPEQRKTFIHRRLYSNVDCDSQFDVPYNRKSAASDKAGFATSSASGFPLPRSTHADADTQDNGEYLESSAEERNFFARCVGIFDIDNARTMIRLHNAVTLIKGLVDALNSDQKALQQYTFLIFWYEAISAAPAEEWSHYQQALAAEPGELPTHWREVARLAQQIGLPARSAEELDAMLGHIGSISLSRVTPA